ncbi:hypothetical protein CL176_05465 [Suicoccus acidiformans]|uniref:Alpha/beta hydrolase domain-containing protein n=1 Tax=Suicoccus acidiformans TaxID=2036206 RepID=A0A347WK83_9LACT|nr:alpha/beta hydrolase domain-containing protein [Suicoccus acidiformans]AXY25490.1 hypothetical protein CL176_05465 [Suicoccus acidiformans]
MCNFLVSLLDYPVKAEAQAYRTRIFVRKPVKPADFSGRMYLDIYNASNGYGIEDVWRRSYQYYIENGHIYIGITSKPVNVQSLEKIDYNRYKSLYWVNIQAEDVPEIINPIKAIPGTEEGLIWDMLSQLGYLIKTNQAPFLANYAVEELYMTGQSQSGIYLNTYVYFFHSYVQEIFDGFLTVLGAGRMRDLRQKERRVSLAGIRDQLIANTEIPFILLSSHGDINLFRSKTHILQDLADCYPKIRHYELASSPHTDPTLPMKPAGSEVAKTVDSSRLLGGSYDYKVNFIQLAYYVNAARNFYINGLSMARNRQLPA